MANNDFLKERAIKYINKDFVSFKRDLRSFGQAHHSGALDDYGESSPGMAIMEFQAYVGDVLSYYMDFNFAELQRDQARLIENVTTFAKSLGYRPSGKRPARGMQAFIINVPSTTVNGQVVPDDSYAPILRKGSRVAGPGGPYETLDDLVFSTGSTSWPRYVTGSQFDSTTGLPTFFAIMKEVESVAGETKSDSFTLGNFQKHVSVELSEQDVIEVLSVTDSDGNTWTEVDYLAQDTVFDYSVNTDSDSAAVPYVLKLQTVPRRFITDRDPTTGKTSLIFGSGDGVNFDDELIPNLADLALPLPGRRTFSSYAIDPQNFIKTRSLGLSPYNTTLTVNYRVGGGTETNSAPRTIRSVVAAELDFSSTSLDPLKVSAVRSSLTTMNREKFRDGGPEETVPEIKANSAAYFAAQNRVVTAADHIVHAMSLPQKFGKPDKVYVRQDNVNARAVDIHLLSRDENNHLCLATPNLKKNIKTWLAGRRILTEGINLLDSDIINLRLRFGVVVAPTLSKTEVMTKCIKVIADYLHVDKMQIGKPIVLSDLSAEIQKVYGVISVYDITFTNIIGTDANLTYSSVRFDPVANTSNNILYCPENGIFEVKFPNRDIIAVAK